MNVFGKATVQVVHATSGNNFYDNDDLFALTIVPNWSNDGSTYYFVSLITDEPSGPCCFGHYWGTLSPKEQDEFIRESVVSYYSHIYREYDEEFTDEAADELEIRYL